MPSAGQVAAAGREASDAAAGKVPAAGQIAAARQEASDAAVGKVTAAGQEAFQLSPVSGDGSESLLGRLMWTPTAPRPEFVLDLLDGLVPGLRNKDEGEEGAGGTDGAVEPEGAAAADGLDQVHKGLGHQEAGDEGEADDEGVGDGSYLAHHFMSVHSKFKDYKLVQQRKQMTCYHQGPAR